MGVADYSVDRKGLGRDLRRSIMRYYGLPLNEIPAMEIWEGLEPIIYEYNLRVPSDYWLLIKTIVIMEGVGLGLDPEYDIVAAAQPYLKRLFRQLWAPSTLAACSWLSPHQFTQCFLEPLDILLRGLLRGIKEGACLYAWLPSHQRAADYSMFDK